MVITRRELLAVAAGAVTQDWKAMFDGRTLDGWKETAFRGRGAVSIRDGAIRLGKARRTGIEWQNAFPKVDYELRFEAARFAGNDFFVGLTFPVGDQFCSWIHGGWGGSVVGLSSLDGDDASENETSTMREFETARWYAFRLEVTANRIRGWTDGLLVTDADIAGRRISLPMGEDDLAASPGFSAYASEAGLRAIAYRLLR